VHPHQDVLLAGDFAVDQGDMLGLVHVVVIADDPELAKLGGEPRFGDPVHQVLGGQPVGHQLGYRDIGEVMGPGELLQLRPAGHGSRPGS
jgi:hypothetical protein